MGKASTKKNAFFRRLSKREKDAESKEHPSAEQIKAKLRRDMLDDDNHITDTSTPPLPPVLYVVRNEDSHCECEAEPFQAVATKTQAKEYQPGVEIGVYVLQQSLKVVQPPPRPRQLLAAKDVSKK